MDSRAIRYSPDLKSGAAAAIPFNLPRAVQRNSGCLAKADVK